MIRTVKLILPFLKRKSNVIELREGESLISFIDKTSKPEVIQVILFNSEIRHLKHFAFVSHEISRLDLKVAGFNSVWIERDTNGLHYEIEAILK